MWWSPTLGTTRVRRVSQGEAVTTLAGRATRGRDGACEHALFTFPTDVAVTAGGHVLVAEACFGRIRLVRGGWVTTLRREPDFAVEYKIALLPYGIVATTGGSELHVWAEGSRRVDAGGSAASFGVAADCAANAVVFTSEDHPEDTERMDFTLRIVNTRTGKTPLRSAARLPKSPPRRSSTRQGVLVATADELLLVRGVGLGEGLPAVVRRLVAPRHRAPVKRRKRAVRTVLLVAARLLALPEELWCYILRCVNTVGLGGGLF